MNTLPTDIIRNIISYNNPKLETLLIGKERCKITDNLLCMYNLTRIQLIKKTFNNNDIIEIYNKQNKFVTYARIGDIMVVPPKADPSYCANEQYYRTICPRSYHHKILVLKLEHWGRPNRYWCESSSKSWARNTLSKRYSYHPSKHGVRQLDKIDLKKFIIKPIKDKRAQKSDLFNGCKSYTIHKCIGNEVQHNELYWVVYIGNNLLVRFKDFLEICDNLEQNSIKDELYKHSVRFLYPYHLITWKLDANCQKTFCSMFKCDILPVYREFIYIKEKAEAYDKSLTENDLNSYYMRSLKKTHTHKTDE